MENLDSDLLRTFIAVAQAGSVTDGATRIHRSQSAASIQIKRLETILGHAVFERHGRGVVLSEVGRRLLPVAQEVTARLDAVCQDLGQDTVSGKLRLGVPDDHGREKLTQILSVFTRQYPLVELEVICALSAGFPDALVKGKLDLAVYEVEELRPHEELLFEDPTCWVSSVRVDFSRAETLPVALFDQACWWRETAIRSLEDQARPYRIAYSSQSVSGVAAAVEAGMAIGFLGRSSLHSGLSVLGKEFGFGYTPSSKLVMASGGFVKTRPIEAMKAAIRSAFV